MKPSSTFDTSVFIKPLSSSIDESTSTCSVPVILVNKALVSSSSPVTIAIRQLEEDSISWPAASAIKASRKPFSFSPAEKGGCLNAASDIILDQSTAAGLPEGF